MNNYSTFETNYIEAILNRPDTQLTHDDWDNEAETKICPVCGYVCRFWYITAYNGDGDYLESLQSHKCLRCDYENFYLDKQDGQYATK